MKFNRKAKVGSVIPTASMADISFLLLVFFMVSTVSSCRRLRSRKFGPKGLRVEISVTQHDVKGREIGRAGRE